MKASRRLNTSLVSFCAPTLFGVSCRDNIDINITKDEREYSSVLWHSVPLEPVHQFIYHHKKLGGWIDQWNSRIFLDDRWYPLGMTNIAIENGTL